MLTLSTLPSPLGPLTLITTAAHDVVALDFEDNHSRLASHLRRHSLTAHPGPPPPQSAEALKAYFEGHLAALAQIPTAPHGTIFQTKVWQALTQIPPGQTRSYAQIAASLSQPTASRAIGLANGQNPISLIIPCHRVIGRDGSLTGYAGGISRKAWLLAHEGATNRLLL